MADVELCLFVEAISSHIMSSVGGAGTGGSCSASWHTHPQSEGAGAHTLRAAIARVAPLSSRHIASQINHQCPPRLALFYAAALQYVPAEATVMDHSLLVD